MQIEVRGKGLHITDVLSRYIQRRLGFALGRFCRRVDRVLVQVEDTNGPKGGIDKQCRVAVVVPHSTTAVMEAKASNIRVAINRAGAKASRYVADRLKQPHWIHLSARKSRGSSPENRITHYC
jgi:ribosome-associated translation inhibitor RaiA